MKYAGMPEMWVLFAGLSAADGSAGLMMQTRKSHYEKNKAEIQEIISELPV